MVNDEANTKVNFDEKQESNVKRVDTPIVVESLKPHLRNEKKQQAQIRSEVESTYPEAGVGNSLNDSIFDQSDFGFGDGQTYVEKRVAWVDVPAGLTIEEVQTQMDNFPHARIYRMLSLVPILTDEQKRAMDAGISEYVDAAGVTRKCDMNYYKINQRIPTPETSAIKDANQRQPLLYKGYEQYRLTAFSKDGMADSDQREAQYVAEQNNAAFKMNDAVHDQEHIAAPVPQQHNSGF